jgi:hypothetical protein
MHGDTMRDHAARTTAALSAIFVWAALLLQLFLVIGGFIRRGDGVLAGLWRYVGFFTILSNSFAALVFTHAAVRPKERSGLGAARVELAMTVAMVIVGVVYALLLRGHWEPRGLQKISDIAVHNISPALCVIFWTLRPHGDVRWLDAAWCLVWPSLYAVYAMLRGALDGWYAYPFLNPVTLTFQGLIGNLMGLGAAVVAVALVFITIDKAMSASAPARVAR